MSKDKTVKTKQRLCVFIDAANVWEAQKAKGRMFDYAKLKQYLKKMFEASNVSVFYYTAYPADGTRDYSLDSKHKFFTYLKKGLGFVVRKKELKRIKIQTKHGEAIQEKGNMDVELAIDVIHFKNKYDIAVFFTGDADFLALVNYVRNGGKRAYVFSSQKNVSIEMRTGSDGYTDVLRVEDDIWGSKLKQKSSINSGNKNHPRKRG